MVVTGLSGVIGAAPEVHTPVRSWAVTAPVRDIRAVGRCRPFGQFPKCFQAGQHFRAIVRPLHPRRQPSEHRPRRPYAVTLSQLRSDVGGQLGDVLLVVGPQDLTDTTGLQPQRPLEKRILTTTQHRANQPSSPHLRGPVGDGTTPSTSQTTRLEQELAEVLEIRNSWPGNHEGTAFASRTDHKYLTREPSQRDPRVMVTSEIGTRLRIHDGYHGRFAIQPATGFPNMPHSPLPATLDTRPGVLSGSRR